MLISCASGDEEEESAFMCQPEPQHPVQYVYPGPFGNGIIRAVHLQELRSGVK